MAKQNNIRDRNPRKDLTGSRYGRLSVVSWAGNSRWNCLCDCGNETKVLTANLNRGNTASCGCVRNIKSSKRATTHGLSNTLAYKTWCSVKRRCLDPNCAAYQQYGARGIGMYAAWIDDPAAFIAYVGEAPSRDYTLDRIDNSRGYEPGNIRWATRMAQANNKTTNRWVTFRGERLTLAQLARKIATECGILPKQFIDAFQDVIGRGAK